VTGVTRGAVAVIWLVLIFVFAGTASMTEFVPSAGPASEHSSLTAASTYSYNSVANSSESTVVAEAASVAAWASTDASSVPSTGNLSARPAGFVAPETAASGAGDHIV
jgi:hypothetical protein